MPKKPVIVHKDLNLPFYQPGRDFVNIPHKEQFKPEEVYYSTLFHELIHATAHKKRLNDLYRQQRENYGFEEFVAEIGASYLNAEAGILFRTINDSATYINGWKKKLKEAIKKDPRFFLRAAAKAQNAADYILDREQGETPRYRKGNKQPNSTEKVKRAKPLVTKKRSTKAESLISSLGGITATDNPKQVRPKIQLKGEIGKIISYIDRYMSLILIKGTRHTSKSEFLMQLANAFGEMKLSVAYIDGEQGGLDASVTRECRDRNTSTQARPYITIFPAVREYEQLNQLSEAYDVILADSVQELGLAADQLGELRQKHTHTIFGFISMVKESGAMYGGNKMEHHPPMIFECHQGEYSDPTEKYKHRYVTCEKNRGNPEAIGLKYNIYQKKTEAIEVKEQEGQTIK